MLHKHNVQNTDVVGRGVEQLQSHSLKRIEVGVWCGLSIR